MKKALKRKEVEQMYKYTRQSGIFPIEKHDKKITIIGVGGIGSFTALVSAKVGFKDIEVWDFDEITDHNLPNQFFRERDIGKPKVIALKEIIRDFEGIKISTKEEPYKVDKRPKGILVVAVDNMEARSEIWKMIKGAIDLTLIDARMGGEAMMLYTINPSNPDDIKFYEKTLYSSEEADPVPCTEKSIAYNVAVIAGLIGSKMKKICMGQDINKEVIFHLKTLSLMTQK